MLATTLCAAPALAQGARSEDAGGAWHAGWTPFAPIADLPRSAPAATPTSSLLLLPAPRVGRGWTAGDPSALADDVRDAWAMGALGGGATSGEFRRPLDAERATLGRLALLGWQPLGEAAGAVGRIVADQERRGPASSGNGAWPYASSPFVVTDSTRPDMRAQRVRLEGAAGWRARGWTGGVSAGYEARDDRSERTPFPRLARLGAPAVGAGIGRDLRGVTLSAFARWQQADETITLVPLVTTGTVWQLEGYGDPDPRAVSGGTPYLRRAERGAWSAGVGASGTLLGARWVATAERGRRRERYSSALRDDPPADRWSADGDRLVLALQRAAWGERLLVTARADAARLDGTGRRLDLSGDVFRAEESSWGGTVDVRTASATSAWRGALALSTRRDVRTRVDFVARRQVLAEGWQPTMAAELARRVGARTDLALGVALAGGAVVASLPDTAQTGDVYRRLVAPALAWEASPMRATAGTFTLRHAVGTRRWVWAAATFDRLTPTGNVAAPLRPAGSRGGWRMQLGATLTADR